MKFSSLLIVPTLLICAAIGCFGKPASHPHSPAPAKPAGARSSAAAQPAATNPYAGNATSEAGGEIEYADPKTGKVLGKVHFDSAEVSNVPTATGSWHNVHGVMYSNGLPADKFTAPLVTGDNEKRILIATGGVMITSLTQANTTLRCDRITWYTSQDKIIGVGHAVLKKGGFFTQSMTSFQADTKLKKIVTPAPGLGTGSSRSVHTRIAR